MCWADRPQYYRVKKLNSVVVVLDGHTTLFCALRFMLSSASC